MVSTQAPPIAPGEPVEDTRVTRPASRVSSSLGSLRRYWDSRAVLRAAASVVLAAAVCLVMWVRRPDHLVQADDIVGYPAFWDFDYHPILLAHRLVVWVLPLGATLIYLILRRWGGPLAAVRRERHRHRSTASRVGKLPEPDEILWVHRLRPLVPALLLTVAAKASGSEAAPRLSWSDLRVGIAYLALVALVSILAKRVSGTSVRAGVHALTAALAGVIALFLFANGTATFDEAGLRRSWAFLPLGVAAALAIVLVAAVCWALSRRPALDVERSVLTYLVGAVAVFVLVARLPTGIGYIQGFDDSHAVVGADLFTRGYFPWSELLVMHGPFEDGLRALLGFALFEHSYWGSAAALAMIWAPVLWIGYYWLLAWAAPRAWMLHVAFVLACPWVAVLVHTSYRWLGIGYVLALLGVALQRRTVTSVVGLTVLLFGFAVVVPEASFLVLSVAAVLVLADLVGHPPGRSLVSRLRLTLPFVIAGVVLTTLFAGWLSIHGALREWVDYYLLFGPGHNESGTLPLDLVDNDGWQYVFYVAEAITLVVIAAICVWCVRGRRLGPRAGVIAAGAFTAGLYAEKGLGRFDIGHIGQVITIAIPVWILLIALTVNALDRRLAGRLTARLATWRRRHRGLVVLRRPTALVAVLLVTVALPLYFGAVTAWERVQRSPAHNRAAVEGQSERAPLVGYTTSSEPDLTMVADLGTLLESLTPPRELVYDFTNSPGYFTYLLQQRLASRFYTVGVALTEDAQDLLVADLKADAPAVVVFDDLHYGLPAWDGPRNSVRHFEVSQYLLDGWTPVASTYGFLFMLRNDLVPSMPPLPTLHEPIETSNLYDAMPACDWGHSAHFLRSDPAGERLELPVSSADGFRLRAAGWAYEIAGDRPVRSIVIAEGQTVLGRLPINRDRSDVASATGLRGAAASGFDGGLVFPAEGTPKLAAYALFADGQARVLSPPPGFRGPGSLVEADGNRIPVVASEGEAVGALDALQGQPVGLHTVELPPSASLSSFDLATFRADGPIGAMRMGIVDQSGMDSGESVNRVIGFNTPARQGSSIAVRVGSCLSWHGFHGRLLVLIQEGGRPITSVTLSGVSDD